jgi:hypothetical protein
LEKKKEKNKNKNKKIKAKVLLRVLICDQDTIESVITLWIDSRTIKEGKSLAKRLSSATR